MDVPRQHINFSYIALTILKTFQKCDKFTSHIQQIKLVVTYHKFTVNIPQIYL